LLAWLGQWLCSATCLSFRDYFWSTAVGTIPGAALYTFIGHGVRNLEQYLRGKESVGPAPLISMVVGVVACVAAFVGLGFYARRRVRATLRAPGYGTVGDPERGGEEGQGDGAGAEERAPASTDGPDVLAPLLAPQGRGPGGTG
jgi:hypothetical protein